MYCVLLKSWLIFRYVVETTSGICLLVFNQAVTNHLSDDVMTGREHDVEERPFLRLMREPSLTVITGSLCL